MFVWLYFWEPDTKFNLDESILDNLQSQYTWLYFYPLYSSPVPPEPGKFFMCESSDENTNKYVVIMLARMAVYLFVFEEHRDSDRTQFWSMSSERRLRERGQRFRLSHKQNKTFFSKQKILNHFHILEGQLRETDSVL